MTSRNLTAIVIGAFAAAGVVVVSQGCGSSSQNLFNNPDGGEGSDGQTMLFGDSSLFNQDGGGPPKPCTPGTLSCQVHGCGNGGHTTITGKVYDPAGKNPLYGIAVYVPNSPLKPLTNGASCDSCDSLFSGDPIAADVTKADGTFNIVDAPDGANIPLVIQVGKWRRQITIPNVTQCTANAQADRSIKLPSNTSEPNSNIPNIAISTGGADTLECLLARIGVDRKEYVAGSGGTQHLHIFTGNNSKSTAGNPPTMPNSPDSATGLWDSKADLMKYDIVLLSCEGYETAGAGGNGLSTQEQQSLADYAGAGGRVFASHYHYAFFNTGPFNTAPNQVATWMQGPQSSCGMNCDDSFALASNVAATIDTTLSNNMPFPRGAAMQTWLGNVGALGIMGSPPNELPIIAARHNVDSLTAASQEWIRADGAAVPPNKTQYFSFDTPIGADAAHVCGRVVFSDLHVGGASMDDPTQAVPQDCANADLSAQEKALEFMLFDLSSCVTPNDQPPMIPPIVH
jgi:hypothetical protein